MKLKSLQEIFKQEPILRIPKKLPKLKFKETKGFGKTIKRFDIFNGDEFVGNVEVVLNPRSKTMQIGAVELEKGKGYGQATYKQITELFPEYTLKSDSEALSIDAEKMWERLVANNQAQKLGPKEYIYLSDSVVSAKQGTKLEIPKYSFGSQLMRETVSHASKKLNVPEQDIIKLLVNNKLAEEQLTDLNKIEKALGIKKTNNLFHPGGSPVAAEYLLTGNPGTIKSTSYFLQGLNGIFPEIEEDLLRTASKYQDSILSLPDIADFAKSDQYKNFITDLTKIIADKYGERGVIALSIISKSPTGLYPKEGQVVSKLVDFFKQGGTLKMQQGGQLSNWQIETSEPIQESIDESLEEEFPFNRNDILLYLPKRGYQMEEFDEDLNDLYYKGQLKNGQLSIKAQKYLQKKYNLSQAELDEVLEELFQLGKADAMITDLPEDSFYISDEDEYEDLELERGNINSFNKENNFFIKQTLN